MWKRDEGVRPTPPQPAPSVPPAQTVPAEPAAAAPRPAAPVEKSIVNIGKSVIIKGELSGSEDLTIEGQVEGKIELRQNVLTIGSNGKIKAEIFAKTLVVLGEVYGNVTVIERIEIRESGSVEGDVSAPRVAIADGAHFRGSIDMQRGQSKAQEPKAQEPKAQEPKAEAKAVEAGTSAAPAKA